MTTLTEELTQNLENVAGTCPACSRYWNLDDSEVKQIKQALATALRGLQGPYNLDSTNSEYVRGYMDSRNQDKAIITAFVESLVKG